MSSVGYSYGSELVNQLRAAIRRCELRWFDDPAYHEVAHLLDEALQRLDALCVSPGTRSAREAASESSQDSDEKSEY
jgi:hypothetical protein